MNLSLKNDLIERIAFCDPAGGEATVKRTRARSAIVVVARDELARFFVLDAWADRVSTDALVNKIFEVQDQWNPFQVGIESTAQQSLFVDMVRRSARLQGRRINIVGVKVSTREKKEYRIRTAIQVPLAQGQLFIQKNKHIELMTELAQFPTGFTVDLVDALASAITMFPPLISGREARTAEKDYADFLRGRGLTEKQISDRIADEFGSEGES